MHSLLSRKCFCTALEKMQQHALLARADRPMQIERPPPSPSSSSSNASTEYEFNELLDELVEPVAASNRPVRSNAVGASHPIFPRNVVWAAAEQLAEEVELSLPISDSEPEHEEEEEQKEVIELTEAEIRAMKAQREDQLNRRMELDEARRAQPVVVAPLPSIAIGSYASAIHRVIAECETAEAQRLAGLEDNALPQRPAAFMVPREVFARVNTEVRAAQTAKAARVQSNMTSFEFMQPITFNPVKWKLPDHRDKEPTLWAWSVKLDGNRALWDGFNKTFTSHTAKIVIPVDSTFWASSMPLNCYLDGELYLPHEDAVNDTSTEFHADLHNVSKVWHWTDKKKSFGQPLWMKLQFHAFDIVGRREIEEAGWHVRHALLYSLNQNGEFKNSTRMPDNDRFKRVKHYYIGSNFDTHTQSYPKDVFTQLEQVKSYLRSRGAEGLVLKRVDNKSTYREGSDSAWWQKIKFYEDIEARVVRRYPEGVLVTLPHDRKDTAPHGIQFGYSNLIQGKAGEPDQLLPNTIVNVMFRGFMDSGRMNQPKLRAVHTVALPKKQNDDAWARIVQRAKSKDEPLPEDVLEALE